MPEFFVAPQFCDPKDAFSWWSAHLAILQRLLQQALEPRVEDCTVVNNSVRTPPSQVARTRTQGSPLPEA